MKYMLSDKEKKIFGIVIPLQVLWGRGAGGGPKKGAGREAQETMETCKEKFREECWGLIQAGLLR